ncbi:MAG: tRNA 2-thiouridine(34) synthase MnmA [Chloroflexi bacterium]|nr:tRNA 2-thiouridine(34) synthase MnmA [Chloroflexota bacterium]
MSEKKTVVVALSGGVDSSTTAALLVERGHNVIGVMMRLWSEGAGDGDARFAQNRCCSPEAVADARGVCQNLGIPFYLLNFEAEFKMNVVKFGTLLDKARALGADYLATGHYARVVERAGKFLLLKGVDPKKDQSYALSVLTQEQLARVMFPLGEFTKAATRELARKFGLRVSEKSESQDLCFIADGDYRNFLRRNIPDSLNAGNIVDARGKVLGRHEGLPFYTIGQREGLRIAARQPLYVLALDSARNAVVVGAKEDLGKRELIARNVNWIQGAPPRAGARVTAMIRYRASTEECAVYSLAENRARAVFDSPVRAIAPGQAVVFYAGEECLGGGIIESA